MEPIDWSTASVGEINADYDLQVTPGVGGWSRIVSKDGEHYPFEAPVVLSLPVAAMILAAINRGFHAGTAHGQWLKSHEIRRALGVAEEKR